jgi:hypothetical protein
MFFFSDPQTDVAPGLDPKPQYAFKNPMLGVSCNSHRLTQLAAFFIEQRAE